MMSSNWTPIVLTTVKGECLDFCGCLLTTREFDYFQNWPCLIQVIGTGSSSKQELQTKIVMNLSVKFKILNFRIFTSDLYGLHINELRATRAWSFREPFGALSFSLILEWFESFRGNLLKESQSLSLRPCVSLSVQTLRKVRFINGIS